MIQPVFSPLSLTSSLGRPTFFSCRPPGEIFGSESRTVYPQSRFTSKLVVKKSTCDMELDLFVANGSILMVNWVRFKETKFTAEFVFHAYTLTIFNKCLNYIDVSVEHRPTFWWFSRRVCDSGKLLEFRRSSPVSLGTKLYWLCFEIYSLREPRCAVALTFSWHFAEGLGSRLTLPISFGCVELWDATGSLSALTDIVLGCSSHRL